MRIPKTAIIVALGVIVFFATDFAFAGDGPLGSNSPASFDDTLIRNAVGNLLELIEGAFGALLMVGAGIVALVFAAMGNYRNALNMLVVAVASFILRSLLSLFFGTDFPAFGS